MTLSYFHNCQVCSDSLDSIITPSLQIQQLSMDDIQPYAPKFTVPSSSQSHHPPIEFPSLHVFIQLGVSTGCTTLKVYAESTQGENHSLYPTFILCQMIIMFML